MTLQLIVVTMMWAYVQAPVPLQLILATTVILLWLAFFAYCEREFRLRGDAATVETNELDSGESKVAKKKFEIRSSKS